jgi:hypothetical protein
MSRNSRLVTNAALAVAVTVAAGTGAPAVAQDPPVEYAAKVTFTGNVDATSTRHSALFKASCYTAHSNLGGGCRPAGDITLRVDAAGRKTLGLPSRTLATGTLNRACGSGTTCGELDLSSKVRSALKATYKKRHAKLGAEIVVNGSYSVELTAPVKETLSCGRFALTAGNTSGGSTHVNFTYTSNYGGYRPKKPSCTGIPFTK